MTSPSPVHILAIGGAHVDRRGHLSREFVPGASNPGVMREDTGGGVFNALRNIARRGDRASILSLRGGDPAGEAVARAIADEGVEDLSSIFLDRATPTYTAFLTREGELLAGLADMSLYDLAFTRQLLRTKAREAIAAADAILCDANLPEPALARLADTAGQKPLFAIAISPAKAVRLRAVADRLSCLFLNRREAAALAGERVATSAHELVGVLRAIGVRRAAVTAGAGALVAFDADAIYEVEPPQPSAIADVTGDGDALAGTVVSALTRGGSFANALREGLAAAKLCIECTGSVPDHAPMPFAEALESVPQLRRVG
jgi:sugar/nucleoside kinase (ribokinase family)